MVAVPQNKSDKKPHQHMAAEGQPQEETMIAARVIRFRFRSASDLGSFPKPVPAILPLFATPGLVDSNLEPKPALATWDKVFARPLMR
jgi:hypothetical protein